MTYMVFGNQPAIPANRNSRIKVVSKRMKHKIGMILLAIWLILTGLMQVISFPIPAIIMAIIAIAAGVLIFMGR